MSKNPRPFSPTDSLLVWLVGLAMASGHVTAQPLAHFFRQHCFDCHSSDAAEGKIELESPQLDWSQPSTVSFWEKVLRAVEDDRMPPYDAEQPTTNDRRAAIRHLHMLLKENARVGGTVLRRLNRVEYENTIRDVLNVPFRVPPSFPSDAELHGFDNVGEGLILSPPLMEQYFEAATQIADLIIPPARPKASFDIPSESVLIEPDDMSVNFEGSKVQQSGQNRTLRLVTKDEVIVRSSSWPTRFEARHSGRYAMRIRLGAFKPVSDKPLEVWVLARKSAAGVFQSVFELRKLRELSLSVDGASEFQMELELHKGETPVIYWADSPFGWNRRENDKADAQLAAHLREPAVYAAWLRMGEDRGRTPTAAWKQMKQLMASGELNLNDPQLKETPERFSATVRNQLMWLFENMRHERGPALDIHSLTITGPTQLVEDEEMRQQRLRTTSFLGKRESGVSDQQYANLILQPFLEGIFRRPPSQRQVANYVKVALAHQQAGHRFEDGIHLALRTALCSPNFLYRGTRPGRLDDYDLASRLSYFLWSAPPDTPLRKLADSGRLSDPDVLAEQTRRLLAHPRSREFVDGFVGQWLDLRLLPEIMPDPRLQRFNAKDLNAIRQETLLSVEEILRENHSIDTLIDPDFTYLNARNAKLYGTKGIKGNDMQRVALEPGGRFGGILGQASVMMATANGVDTQPVLRGVWLLENVLGQATPPPPSNVPAIEPDTTGAKTIRELLSRHRSDPSCAQCHVKIDPLGFALENFDPIGRWRTHYPIYEQQNDGTVVTRDGLPVDATGVLPDGSSIQDVVDLKQYLVRNIDLFSGCLAEKLLVYATGRRLNYADRQIVEQLVQDTKLKGNGFQDLIVAIVQSKSFLTK